MAHIRPQEWGVGDTALDTFLQQKSGIIQPNEVFGVAQQRNRMTPVSTTEIKHTIPVVKMELFCRKPDLGCGSFNRSVGVDQRIHFAKSRFIPIGLNAMFCMLLRHRMSLPLVARIARDSRLDCAIPGKL